MSGKFSFNDLFPPDSLGHPQTTLWKQITDKFSFNYLFLPHPPGASKNDPLETDVAQVFVQLSISAGSPWGTQKRPSGNRCRAIFRSIICFRQIPLGHPKTTLWKQMSSKFSFNYLFPPDPPGASKNNHLETDVVQVFV